LSANATAGSSSEYEASVRTP